ncbi:MAG: hypothetical protein ABSG25_07705 [Bryobacteraceae bacterium]
MEWLFLLGVLVCAIFFPQVQGSTDLLGCPLWGLIAYILISHNIEKSVSKIRITTYVANY